MELIKEISLSLLVCKLYYDNQVNNLMKRKYFIVILYLNKRLFSFIFCTKFSFYVIIYDYYYFLYINLITYLKIIN